jgi:hypothetical protein
MATFEYGKLLLVSSPHVMSGVLWDVWRTRNDDEDVLVWHAPTSVMNPTVRERFLEKEKARDPENYRREYLAEFTDAVTAFLSAEAIERCVVKGRAELPPERRSYIAAVDAAFKGDRFTLCIAHRDRDRDVVTVDCLRGWQGTRQAPLLLSGGVMPEIRALSDRYGFRRVYGDQFGAQPLKDVFSRHGLYYEERTFTNTSKADIYATLRTRISDGTVELLDHEPSLRELRALQLERLPGGTMRIGHSAHGRDDFADAIALAVSEARRRNTVRSGTFA